MKALIVDDNEDIRSLIKVILESKGHTVVGEAEDGEGALKAFAELRPEVVLLDIIMPGKSGLEVLEEIRGMDPRAKVILVTAVEQDRLNRQLLDMGAAGMICKPFVPGDFDKAFRAIEGEKPGAGGRTDPGEITAPVLKPAPAAKPAAGETNERLSRLAAAGLSKCMLRTTDASSWAWELCGVEVFTGKIADAVKKAGFGPAVAGVQVNIRNRSPFSAALIFRSADIGFISGCFVSGPLYRTPAVTDLDEGLLMEIGNIILNALSNPLINAVKENALPSVPFLVKGGPGAVAASLSAWQDPKLEFRVIAASLAMRREGRLARAGVLCFLPKDLAEDLERGTD